MKLRRGKNIIYMKNGSELIGRNVLCVHNNKKKNEKKAKKKKRMGNSATFGHLNSLQAVVSDLFQFNAFFLGRVGAKNCNIN